MGSSQLQKIESFDSGKFDEWKQNLNFNLTKKPDLVLIARKYFRYNYILSLALFFIIILIRKYII